MARHNLKLNYSELEKLATSCLELGSSLDEIKSTVKNMEKTIANCKGQAASSITGDGDEIVESIDKLKTGLDKFATETNSFVSDMSGIINAQGGGMLQVNSWDCNFNLGQMISDLVSFNSYAQGSRSNVSYASGGFSMSMLPQDEVAKINQINANLENVVELMKSAARDLLKYEDDFQKFKKTISDFENKDDDYRNSMQNIYYDVADVDWLHKTSTKIIIAVAVIAVAAAIVIFAPAIAGLAGVGGAVGAIATAASSATAVGIATEIVTVGVGTGVISAGVSVLTGDDVEDALGSGLMDGVIAGAISGGVGAIADSTKIATMGTKLSEYASSKGVMLTGNTARSIVKEGVQYSGEVASSIADCLYNGNDINMLQIGTTAAFDRGKDKAFEAGGDYLNKKISDGEINLFRDGKFSMDDAKKAVKKIFTDRSLEAGNEITGQVGHEIIDNTLVEQSENGIEIEAGKIPENYAQDGMEKIVKDSLENVSDNVGHRINR